MASTVLTPSYYGFIGSTKDALLIIQAVLDKKLNLTPRRPHERERASTIKSGNVFVFIEEQSGIKRWTDGIAWSPSRILGRFLVYRELDKHSLSEKDEKKKRRKLSTDFDPLQIKASPSQQPQFIPPAHQLLGSAPSPERGELNKNLVGSLVTSYVFKDHGLIKKTLSVTTNSEQLNIQRREGKQTIHLISYYNVDDVLNAKLQRPSESDFKGSSISNDLWNAIKDSSLGGKIPIEDEARYFLDNNYQLQHMSSLQHPIQQHQQIQHQFTPHNPTYVQSSIVQPQYMTPPKYPGQIVQANQQDQYMLPLPIQVSHPLPHFGPTNLNKEEYGQHQGPLVPGVKREEDLNHGSSSELTFINPFTGSIYQANQGPSHVSGTGSAPGSTSGASSSQHYNNRDLSQQQTQQQHPNYHYQYDAPTNYQSTQHYPPVPHPLQQHYSSHLNNHPIGSVSSSSDQNSISGGSNGSISSLKISFIHGNSVNSVCSPPSSNYQKHYRTSSNGNSIASGNWIPPSTANQGSYHLYNAQQNIPNEAPSNVEHPIGIQLTTPSQLNADEPSNTTHHS